MAILFHPTLSFVIIKQFTKNHSRLIMLDYKINKQIFNHSNVYMALILINRISLDRPISLGYVIFRACHSSGEGGFNFVWKLDLHKNGW